MNDDHFNHDAHVQALEEDRHARRGVRGLAYHVAATPWIGPSPVMFPLDEEAE